MLEAVTMTTLVLKLDSSSVLKVNFKREKKSFTLLPFTRLMSLTLELKALWRFLLVTSVKLNLKFVSKLIKKLLNGVKKVELK